MLPVIKNDHPLFDPKVRRPSISSSTPRKSSYTFGENRNINHGLSSRQKSKSVSNEPSMMQTRIELQIRKRSHTSNNPPIASTSTETPKVGGANYNLDTPSKHSYYFLQNRNCPSGSHYERKVQLQSKFWTQSPNLKQSKKKTSDIR